MPFPALSTREACSGLSGPTGRGRRPCFAFLAALCLRPPVACGFMAEIFARFPVGNLPGLSVLFRNRCLCRWPFTVSEFVAVGRTPHLSGWPRLSGEDVAAVDRAMEMTDIRALQNRLVDELSAGEKQRAVVAMALAQEPRILLLDEPTAHLDIQHAWNLMELIVKLNREQGVTVVLSSHDLNLAAEFCSHLLLMEEGRLAAHGTPREVMDSEKLSGVYKHPLERVNMANERFLVVPRRL